MPFATSVAAHFLCSCALGTSCISLFTNELTIQTSPSEIAVTCPNSNVKVLHTTSFPLHSCEEVEEYISWYSRTTETIKEHFNFNSTGHNHLIFGVSSSLAIYLRINKSSDFVNHLLFGDSKIMASALLAFVNVQ